MITSAANPRVKLLRSLHERKHRRELGLCLLEGVRLVEEAIPLGLQHAVYAPERLSATAAGRALRQRLERLPDVEQVDERLLDAISDTVTSQGVLAAAPIPAAQALPPEGHVLVLDGIADPGNAGTMLRTARAAGAAGVVAMRSTTDLWAPKVLRAGMGAHFHLPLLVDVVDTSVLGGRQLLRADAHGGDPYWKVDWSRPSAIVIGSEAHGSAIDAHRVTIPMAEGAESLNAAAAAAVLLFAARRSG
ncbi:MAG TPA: RNA methyltransferase [Chloroflexota bacterium]|nr:RNA methyltransferase [Chloroflexota bacterium]